MNEHTNQPTFRAFTVIKREGQNDFWAPIGAAFPHGDRLGFNILLQALPIDGKVVLRPAKEKQSAEPPE
jgi:hypothetical protein